MRKNSQVSPLVELGHNLYRQNLVTAPRHRFAPTVDSRLWLFATGSRGCGRDGTALLRCGQVWEKKGFSAKKNSGISLTMSVDLVAHIYTKWICMLKILDLQRRIGSYCLAMKRARPGPSVPPWPFWNSRAVNRYEFSTITSCLWFCDLNFHTTWEHMEYLFWWMATPWKKTHRIPYTTKKHLEHLMALDTCKYMIFI